MTYYTDIYIQTYYKNFGSKYGKKFLNKGISASKRIKTVAKNFNESKFGKMLKEEGTKVGKLALPAFQLSDKIIPAAVDLAGSKRTGKITSL